MTVTGGRGGALTGTSFSECGVLGRWRSTAGWAVMRALPDQVETSEGAAATQHRGNGLGENLEIQAERPVVDVLHVRADPVLEAERALVHLVVSLEYLPDAESAFVGAPVDPQHVAHRQRPRPDEAHVAAQDVQELRQLVEAELPEHPPDARDTRVLADLEDGTRRFVQA